MTPFFLTRPVPHGVTRNRSRRKCHENAQALERALLPPQISPVEPNAELAAAIEALRREDQSQRVYEGIADALFGQGGSRG